MGTLLQVVLFAGLAAFLVAMFKAAVIDAENETNRALGTAFMFILVVLLGFIVIG